MYILNGIAHAGHMADTIAVTAVKPLDDMMMLVTFNHSEQRLFDATTLLSMPAFAPLRENTIFRNCQVAHGFVSWQDGHIDLAPETMYQQSIPYNHIEVS